MHILEYIIKVDHVRQFAHDRDRHQVDDNFRKSPGILE